MITIHLIANAHLDPVWLWDWREGLNEGIQTCNTVLDLMDEWPDLTFIRGESAIYEHIEKFSPVTFARIKAMIEAGRWDVVGGSYIQPDTNLTGEATLRKHFERGLGYFQSRFGATPTVAWAADSFGHSAGLPNILHDAGMRGFAFTRPFAGQMTLPGTPFWWEGEAGKRILAYRPECGVYITERDQLTRKLDDCLAVAQRNGKEHIGCFYGIGNHGGGPTQRYMREIGEWQSAHPDVAVVHSGLHRMFDAFFDLAKEKGEDFFPTVHGELNGCLRGCYSSVAKLKFAYRRVEAAVERAETAGSVIAAATQTAAPDLAQTWDSLLFNSFHDILPGTSVERALDDQLDWLGSAAHNCRKAEMESMQALAVRIDTTVPPVQDDYPTAVPFLLFNPHPHAFSGMVELEAALDYRPIFAYAGRGDELPLEVRGPNRDLLPFQVARNEHDFFSTAPWRRRVIVPVELPARGYQVVTLGYSEGGEPGIQPSPTDNGTIENEAYRVSAAPGENGVHIWHRGRALFDGRGMHALTMNDPWGSWGGMEEEPPSLDISDVRDEWVVEQVQTLDDGPLRRRLWVRLRGGNSWLDLVYSLDAGREALDIEARLLWNERSARLKLVIGQAEEAEFQVPGAISRRGPSGEVPGGRWVRLFGSHGTDGFASDALYNFDLKDGLLRATLARATRYATDRVLQADQDIWRPATDAGELRFRMLLAPGDEQLPRLSLEQEQPVLMAIAVASKGDLERAGTL